MEQEYSVQGECSGGCPLGLDDVQEVERLEAAREGRRDLTEQLTSKRQGPNRGIEARDGDGRR